MTGGARGIGEAISKALAADGFNVVVADLREEEAEATMSTLRLVLLFVVSLALIGALTGCPGPNYAPYDNMNNNSPG